MSETPDDQVHTERLREQDEDHPERTTDDEVGRGGALDRLGTSDDDDSRQ